MDLAFNHKDLGGGVEPDGFSGDFPGPHPTNFRNRRR
jgi:hypothetical protein